jgi:hypothetical protein
MWEMSFKRVTTIQNSVLAGSETSFSKWPKGMVLKIQRFKTLPYLEILGGGR